MYKMLRIALPEIYSHCKHELVSIEEVIELSGNPVYALYKSLMNHSSFSAAKLTYT